MRKKFLTLFFVYFSLIAVAQSVPENTLTFLGIPIDGSEQEMIAQLKQKGFKEKIGYNCLTGQFNGKTVDVYISTYHQVVDRICVVFPRSTERSIRTEYNYLLYQFKNNNKYFEYPFRNEEIPKGEDIGYEMKVNKKEYSAYFSYVNPDIGFDETAIKDMYNEFVPLLMSENDVDEFYSRYMDDSVRSKVSVLSDFLHQTAEAYYTRIKEIDTFAEKEKLAQQYSSFLFCTQFITKLMSEGGVSFMIHEDNGKYFIALYYDNLVNRPSGEDL